MTPCACGVLGLDMAAAMWRELGAWAGMLLLWALLLLAVWRMVRGRPPP